MRDRALQGLKWISGILRGIVGVFVRQKGAKELLLSTLSFFTNSDHVLGKPVNVTIEPINICNLRCPVCETGAGVLAREKRRMTLDEFKAIIDKISAFTNTLTFYFMGEPLLNDDSYRMIGYAKKRKIPFVTTCTNGSFVNPKELIASGIDEVNFQISGLTQNVHEIYRVGSDLNSVIANLKDTIKERNKNRSKMRIVSSFILMKHNEHQVDEFKKYMKEVGPDKTVIVDPCVRNVEQGKKFLPTDEKHWIYDPISFSKGELRLKKNPGKGCSWIYYSVVIHANGDVVPCCRDVNGDFIMGNMLKDEFDSIWNGQKFIDFRDNINNDKGSIGICKLCPGYGIAQLRNSSNKIAP